MNCSTTMSLSGNSSQRKKNCCIGSPKLRTPSSNGGSWITTPRFSAAGMVRMKNHEKSGWVHLIWDPGQVLTAGCGETPGRALSFRTSRRRFPRTENDDESSIAAYKLQLTLPAGTEAPPAGTEGLFFQTFQPSFVISWPISTNEPSLESLKSQQSDGAIFVPVSPRERTRARFLRRVLTLSAQFPRIRTCSGQINLYRGEIAVPYCHTT